MKWNGTKNPALGAAFVLLALAGGCELRQGMYDTGRIKPLEKSDFFADSRSARVPPEGTVARGELREDEALFAGKSGGKLLTVLPLSIGKAEMARGREMYEVYCSVCHGHVGMGNGMIVQRGYRRPPSLHDERLRSSPVGHFFDVMTNGSGVMPSYRTMIGPRDRWKIVAYIRALQLSQHARIQDVPAAIRQSLLEEGKQ